MTLLQNTQAIISFCLIIFFLLALFSLPVMIPKLLRAYRLKKLAQRHNLNFKINFWSNISWADMPDHMEQNVIEGTIKGKNIRVYDSFDINKAISNPLMPEIMYGKNAAKPYKRSTIFELGDEKEIIAGSFVFPFAQIEKIRERIEKI